MLSQSEWHHHKSLSWSDSYARSVLEALDKDVFPYLSNRSVTDILPLEMLEILRRIENEALWKNYARSGNTAIRFSVMP